MKTFISLLTLLCAFNFSQAHATTAAASPLFGERAFAPKNRMRIPMDAKIKNNMTKEEFEAIIKRVYDVYAPIIAARGATFTTENNWEDDTVNAYANQFGTSWVIYMYGGLARHPLVTDDGFLLVVCHETGHHLGGVPKYYGNDWASNEGQADYFGALKCMKRVLEKDDNISVVAGMTVDPEVTKKCGEIYKTPGDIALCKRISMAGKSLALLLATLSGEPDVAFDTPDKTVVTETYDYHPNSQCRLDTYFGGALCDKPFTEDVSDTSPGPGTCLKSDGYKIGYRPLCWYKPRCDEVTGLCLK